MREKVFQELFRNHIIYLGGIAKKIPGNLFMKGWPDVYIAIRNGDMSFQGWIEFKGPKTKVEPLQWKIIRDLQFRGVNAFVIRAHEDKTWSYGLTDDDWYFAGGWDKGQFLPELLEAATLCKLNIKVIQRNLIKES